MLDLYDVDETQHTQIARACEIGRERLVELRQRRDDLVAAIEELETALTWGEQQTCPKKRINAA